MNEKKEIRIIAWIELLQSRGSYSFALESAKGELPDYTEIALKRALSRLSEKGKIISIYKGFYLILPPQYASKGVLPPSLFLDDFFQFLRRSYYVSLLNAAAFHGASHQQPQEYFVMTNFPVMRATKKRGLKINYVSIEKIPEKLLEKRKTEAGYLAISNPVLTATDLVQFEKRIGGLNRAATLLIELMEVLKPSDFNEDILDHAAVTTLQRLGYLLEFACSNANLSDSLFRKMEKHKSRLFRVPLKASAQTRGFSSGNRWKVIVNTEIDIDL
ncbi:MAG: type IV toxin-antitoxin system AbiEi family antitoxin [Bacteroidales bacterium]|nr:type IV toxin-antitoxin system AbiEi family antitoxin [Bacteroidales bacterium]